MSQTAVKNSVCVLAGYMVPVLQNGALKWKKKTDWSQISRSDRPSHIKIENSEEKPPTKIHNALHKS